MKESKLDQAVKLLNYYPNISASDIAKKLKVSKVYGYTLRSKALRSKAMSRSSKSDGNTYEVYLTPEIETKNTTNNLGTTIVGLSGNTYQPMDCSPPNQEDLVNHPQHYKTGGIETIDFIEAKRFNYHLGNAVKYISRAKHKENYVQDLEKAVWYIQREINNASPKNDS